MKTIGPENTYIDYFQTVGTLTNGLNLFGIRVAERRCFVVVKTGDGQPNSYRKHYALPMELQALPNHVRMIVEDHLLNYPGSDLADVLTGKKMFQDALNSPAGLEEKPTTTANGETSRKTPRENGKGCDMELSPRLLSSKFRHRQEPGFLKNELQTSSRSANLASLMYQTGNEDSAERTIADAEQGYTMLSGFLSDPLYSKHLPIKAIQRCKAELVVLRNMLDGLEQLRKEGLQAVSDGRRSEFIKSELNVCSTFTTLAATKYIDGSRNSGEPSLGYAEEAYAALLPLLSDARDSKHLAGEQVPQFTAEMKLLRERLDGLQQLTKRWTKINVETNCKSSNQKEFEIGLKLEETMTTVSALKEISEPENQREVAALAYDFWQARGCPDGTPDEDWFRAKRELAESKIHEQEVGSLESTEQEIAKKSDSSVVRFPVRSELSQAAHAGASRRA